MPDQVRVESNERFDIQDFEYMANEYMDALARHPIEVLEVPSGQKTWVISGFGQSNPAGAQVQVDRGVAILARRVGGQVLYGLVTTEGDIQQIVDMAGFGDGTYQVYIRFEYIPTQAQSRTFWNPAGSGSEFSQTINTRQGAAWSTRIESGTPGTEWLRIAQVVKTGGSVVITDERDLYFEGPIDGSPDPYRSDWGSGNDRNADRDSYGIRDWRTFTAAMRAQIENVQARLNPLYARDWWDNGLQGPDLQRKLASIRTNALHQTETGVGVALYDVTYGYAGDGSWGPMFVAVGQYIGAENFIRWSAYARTWNDVVTPPDVGSADLFGVGYGNGYYVAVGTDDATRPVLLYSNDPVVSWSQNTNLPSITIALNAVMYGNGVWVAVGEEESGSPVILTATDPTGTWTRRTSVAKIVDLKDVVYGPAAGLWVAVGTAEGATDPMILTAPDPTSTWTERPNPDGGGVTSIDLHGVTYGEELGRFIAVGNVDSGQSYIIRSDDGITWYRSGIPNPHAVGLNDVAYDPGSGLYLAVGDIVAATAPYVLVSERGDLWERRDKFIGTSLNTPAYAAAFGVTGILAIIGEDTGAHSLALFNM